MINTEDNKKTDRELVEVLYNHLSSRDAFITVSKAGVIKVDEYILKPGNTLSWLQVNARSIPEISPLLLIDPNKILAMFRVVHAQNIRVSVPYEEVEVKSYDFGGLIPFQSVTDSSHYVLFDTNSNTVMDLDYKTFKETLGDRSVPPIRGRIEFNPYFPKPITFREDQYRRMCNFLNTYRKPEWQDEDAIDPREIAKIQMPFIVVRFLKHLFPDDETREYVLDWLHFALTDRCETYLVLNGAKGIGKNIFSENLCRSLMGVNNHKMAQSSALDTNFGALLKDCRMIVFDEIRVDTPEKINRLKRYVNEEQMLEFKGMDVGATVKTYNSFIISNNSKDDMKAISWDERRFSVPNLTDTKLRDVWSDKEIRELIEALEDPEIMRQVGYSIMYRKPTYSKYDDLKDSHFYELCYNSFTEWQKVIVDMSTTKAFTVITSADVRKEYRKRTEGTRVPGFNKVREFVENYRHNGKYPIGTISKEGVGRTDTWTIELSEHFRGESVEADFALEEDMDLLA